MKFEQRGPPPEYLGQLCDESVMYAVKVWSNVLNPPLAVDWDVYFVWGRVVGDNILVPVYFDHV